MGLFWRVVVGVTKGRRFGLFSGVSAVFECRYVVGHAAQQLGAIPVGGFSLHRRGGKGGVMLRDKRGREIFFPYRGWKLRNTTHGHAIRRFLRLVNLKGPGPTCVRFTVHVEATAVLVMWLRPTCLSFFRLIDRYLYADWYRCIRQHTI